MPETNDEPAETPGADEVTQNDVTPTEQEAVDSQEILGIKYELISTAISGLQADGVKDVKKLLAIVFEDQEYNSTHATALRRHIRNVEGQLMQSREHTRAAIIALAITLNLKPMEDSYAGQQSGTEVSINDMSETPETISDQPES